MRWHLDILIFALAFSISIPAAQAQSWDFLFTDLTWPDAGNPVAGALPSFGEKVHKDTGDGWGRIFRDLSWSEEGSPLAGIESLSWGSDAGSSRDSAGLWDYVFADIVWPEETQPLRH